MRSFTSDTSQFDDVNQHCPHVLSFPCAPGHLQRTRLLNGRRGGILCQQNSVTGLEVDSISQADTDDRISELR